MTDKQLMMASAADFHASLINSSSSSIHAGATLDSTATRTQTQAGRTTGTGSRHSFSIDAIIGDAMTSSSVKSIHAGYLNNGMYYHAFVIYAYFSVSFSRCCDPGQFATAGHAF